MGIVQDIKDWWYDYPQWVRYPLGWLLHGGITALAWVVGLPFGVASTTVTLAGGAYIGLEVEQHRAGGTHGVMGWVDRILDAAVPLAVMGWLW